MRAVVVTIFLLAWGVGHAAAWPLARLVGHGETWRRNLLGGGCRGVLQILAIDVAVEGRLPDESGVLVTNHLGYVDVLVLGSILDVVFVSRADVQRWPLIGPLARASGTVFIDRERKGTLPAIVEELREWNARGTRIVFFPEGTSGRGDVVMPFRSSLFEAPVRSGAVVHAAALHYATLDGDAPADRAVCWWGTMDFTPHAWELLRLRRVRARVTFSDEAIRSADRKEAARRAQTAVEGVFTPSAEPDEATVHEA